MIKVSRNVGLICHIYHLLQLVQPALPFSIRALQGWEEVTKSEEGLRGSKVFAEHAGSRS